MDNTVNVGNVGKMVFTMTDGSQYACYGFSLGQYKRLMEDISKNRDIFANFVIEDECKTVTLMFRQIVSIRHTNA